MALFEAVKVRLDPTPRQARLLESHTGAARFAYNLMLNHVQDQLASGEAPDWTMYAMRRWWNEHKNDLANGAEQRFAKALAIYAGFSSLGDAFTHIDTLTEKPVSGQRKNDLRALVTILTGTAPSYSLTSEELRDIIRANTKPTPITNTEEEE